MMKLIFIWYYDGYGWEDGMDMDGRIRRIGGYRVDLGYFGIFWDILGFDKGVKVVRWMF